MQVRTQEVRCPACGGSRRQSVARTRDFCYETCDNEFEYVACVDCGQHYLLNRPEIAALDTIYPPAYISNDYKTHLGPVIARLRDAFQRTKIGVLRRYLVKGDILAEIGPGAGDLLDVIRRLGDPTWDIVGIEFSATAVAALEQRCLRAIHSRIEDVTWTDRPAGAFIMNQLIEHVEDPKLVLRKCFDALRPGGIMVIETPNLKGWDRRMFPPRYWAGWHAPRHWALFDPESLTRMARSAGFDAVEVNSILSPFTILHNIQYFLRERLGWKHLAMFFDLTHLAPLFAASALDQLVKLCGGTTSNMQIVLRKPAMGVGD